MVAIAIQQYAWLVPQKLYFKKGEETFYKFEKMEADSGQFTYVDLFGKKHGVEVPHEELKMFRPTDKKAPERIDARDLATLSLQQSSAWKLELEKAEVQAAILRASMDAKPLELENFLVFSNQKLFTAKDIKKGDLKLLPSGSIQKGEGRGQRQGQSF